VLIASDVRAYICRDPVDMRKAIDGLSYLVEPLLAQRREPIPRYAFRTCLRTVLENRRRPFIRFEKQARVGLINNRWRRHGRGVKIRTVGRSRAPIESLLVDTPAKASRPEPSVLTTESEYQCILRRPATVV
jgi:hypothetical protein